MAKDFSIIIPVYNEQELLLKFYERISSVMNNLSKNYELLFINDGSLDGSEKILRELEEKDPLVRVLHFSRNFGHQIAITAGLDHAEGKVSIIIDADLQDPPEEIPLLVDKWKEGYNVVYGKRSERLGESWFKKFSAKIYYRLLYHLADIEIPQDVGDFRLIDENVRKALVKFREHHRYIRGIISWLGFRQTEVYYVRDKRNSGETKYTLAKMLNLSADGILSFSNKPLYLSFYFGLLVSLLSMLYLIYVVFEALYLGTTVAGWASIICIILFFNGAILSSIGIASLYIAKIFTECKDRPLYIIKEK